MQPGYKYVPQLGEEPNNVNLLMTVIQGSLFQLLAQHTSVDQRMIQITVMIAALLMITVHRQMHLMILQLLLTLIV